MLSAPLILPVRRNDRVTKYDITLAESPNHVPILFRVSLNPTVGPRAEAPRPPNPCRSACSHLSRASSYHCTTCRYANIWKQDAFNLSYLLTRCLNLRLQLTYRGRPVPREIGPGYRRNNISLHTG
jgi:hypothetical protein